MESILRYRKGMSSVARVGWRRVGTAAAGEIRFELQRPANALPPTCED